MNKEYKHIKTGKIADFATTLNGKDMYAVAGELRDYPIPDWMIVGSDDWELLEQVPPGVKAMKAKVGSGYACVAGSPNYKYWFRRWSKANFIVSHIEVNGLEWKIGDKVMKSYQTINPFTIESFSYNFDKCEWDCFITRESVGSVYKVKDLKGAPLLCILSDEMGFPVEVYNQEYVYWLDENNAINQSVSTSQEIRGRLLYTQKGVHAAQDRVIQEGKNKKVICTVKGLKCGMEVDFPITDPEEKVWYITHDDKIDWAHADRVYVFNNTRQLYSFEAAIAKVKRIKETPKYSDKDMMDFMDCCSTMMQIRRGSFDIKFALKKWKEETKAVARLKSATFTPLATANGTKYN